MYLNAKISLKIKRRKKVKKNVFIFNLLFTYT